MNNDYKIILRDIVELFYQPPFKIFNVNSVDGETLVRPFGYFISLGITTSFDILKNIRDLISKSDYGFEAKLVELESIKSDEYGDFLNVLSDLQENEIKKYPSTPPENIEVLEKEDAENLLSELTEKINSGDYSVSMYRQKLADTIKKIENWEDHGLQIKNGQPGVFHKFINYKKISLTFFKMYYYIEGVLLIIISLLLFKCFKINNNFTI